MHAPLRRVAIATLTAFVLNALASCGDDEAPGKDAGSDGSIASPDSGRALDAGAPDADCCLDASSGERGGGDASTAGAGERASVAGSSASGERGVGGAGAGGSAGDAAGSVGANAGGAGGAAADSGGAGGAGAGGAGAAAAPNCTPSSVRVCYTGPAATLDVGICHAGTQTCASDGSGFGACSGETVPAATEDCATAVDDNCDGVALDSSAGCVCTVGSSMPCYEGPGGTQDVGLCHAGVRSCALDGKSYGACQQQVLPAAESCTTPGDDNCDGSTNEGCICVPGQSNACYTGPNDTLNVGLCRAGAQTCNAQGTAYGVCTGDVVPSAENCSTAGDDNCDGRSNEGCGTSTSYAADVQPILAAHCGPCHTVNGAGGGNFASQYSATQLASTVCSGLTKGACTIVRIQNGSMPRGAGCSGNPAADSSNPACLNAQEQAVVQAWIAGGQQP